MANQESLEEAGIIPAHSTLSPEQNEVVESLTPEELEVVISSKDRLGNTVDEVMRDIPNILARPNQ